ncbi:5373_t:CDS:2, partial [Scutellospora calospora]
SKQEDIVYDIMTQDSPEKMQRIMLIKYYMIEQGKREKKKGEKASKKRKTEKSNRQISNMESQEDDNMSIVYIVQLIHRLEEKDACITYEGKFKYTEKAHSILNQSINRKTKEQEEEAKIKKR